MRILPGLNFLRAIAASLVLVGHVYQIATITKVSKSNFHKYFAGDLMVNLFFVISGFIISYTLLNEKNKNNFISLKTFYLKRILRIWPLYFLIAIFVFLLSRGTDVYGYPFDSFSNLGVLAVLLFAVNTNDIIIHIPISVLNYYWSLSVEEQFYLFWPLIMRTKYIPKAAVILIVGWVLIRNSSAWLGHHGFGIYFTWINGFLYATKIPSMAIGALGAYAVVYDKKWFSLFVGKWQSIVLWIVFIATTAMRYKLYIPFVNYEILAILYLLLVLNVIEYSPEAFTEIKAFTVTGRISYGIYMYHWVLVPILIYWLKHIGIIGYFTLFYNLPLIALSYAITWCVSYYSFYNYEAPIIKLIHKKEKIKLFFKKHVVFIPVKSALKH